MNAIFWGGRGGDPFCEKKDLFLWILPYFYEKLDFVIKDQIQIFIFETDI